MRHPNNSPSSGLHARRNAPHRYRPVVRRSTVRAQHYSALRVALAPVLIVALMVAMWAIAFELERQARRPDFAQIHEAVHNEEYQKALAMLERYRPRTLAGEIDVRKARARCFTALEKPEKAIVQLRWLVVHDEVNAAAYHRRLGDLFTELEEHDAAQVHFRQAEKLD